MKKFMFVFFLIALCAAFEMPEDYQLDRSSRLEQALLNRQENIYIPSYSPNYAIHSESRLEL